LIRWWAQVKSVEPMQSKQMPSEAVPLQMLVLLVEMLRAEELPELAVGGAFGAVHQCLHRPGLAPMAMELGVIHLAAEHLREMGSPADAVSVSRGRAGRAYLIIGSAYAITRLFSGQSTRPDLDACVASGVFDSCVEMVAAVAAAGVDGLDDTNHAVLIMALSFLPRCRTHPGCEAKIRGAAGALAFCLEHSLDQLVELGYTTGAIAARAICSVFSRDEGGSAFSFTPQHIELLTEDWSQSVRAVGWKTNFKPTADSVFAAELCVSDAKKPLLIANPNFIPYLVDALLLDPEHPRAGMKEELKAWCQQHHTEALAQLAVFEPSREALLRDGTVVPALKMVVKDGLSEAARETAAAALSALSDKKLDMKTEGQKHVMLSCEFSSYVAAWWLFQLLSVDG
jgi:hypothetical protein